MRTDTSGLVGYVRYVARVVSVVLFFLPIVIVEFSLRELAPVPDPYEVFKVSRSNPFIRSEHAPNLLLHTISEEGLPNMPKNAVFTTNSLGFRGGPISVPKPQGEVRIFLVGGSTTEGLYLDDSQALNMVLQNELQRRTANSAIKVYNAGKSGDRTDDHIAMIVHRIVHLEPDLLVVFPGFNDLIIRFNYAHFENSRATNLTFLERLKLASTDFQIGRRLQYVFKKYLVRKSVKDRLEQITLRSNIREKAAITASQPISDRPPARLNLSGYERNLKTIAGVARLQGIPLIFVTQQTTWNTSVDPQAARWQWMLLHGGIRYRADLMDQALESLNDVTRKVGAASGVPVWDTARLIPKSSEYFYDDVHFNVRGTREAGVGLATVILEKGLLADRGVRGRQNEKEVRTSRVALSRGGAR